MGQALYRKYRSRSLGEIVGQEHVTTLLANALKRNKIAHAYLFTGPKGVGKTSIARILAHEINGLPYSDESTHLDIIEIDAASNNGVDDIRDLREKVNLAPTSAAKKVYIIDEVHMLSKPAFNALLKTLEEPPEHVVFILATTDFDKLPETIISRTQRHTFRRATIEDLKHNLRSISDHESIDIDDDALTLIAQHADGSFRDSVSLLDQISSSTNKDTVTMSTVEASLGLAAKDRIDQLIETVSSRHFTTVVKELTSIVNAGTDATTVAKQLLQQIIYAAADVPELLSLVDGLVRVGQSPMPYASLLALLGNFAQTPDIASDTKPVSSLPSKPPTAQPAAKANIPSKATLSKTLPKNQPTSLDWQQAVTTSKSHSIGLHSVLVKCNAIAENSTLTIYTRNTFYEKKLKTPAYQKALHATLTTTTGYDWEVVTIPGLAPATNSQVAAVTAMMGGGEEVSLDE